MKLVSTHLSYLLTQHETRQNLRALAKYVLFLLAVIAVYSLVFHWIMLEVEDRRHSWITGVYWTLTVMSTLGFGDITFQSDLGRLFSVLVLLSGVVLLLIVLPFAFIRFFYAPWLEAQIRLRAPRALPEGTRGHVVVCRDDAIARGLMARLTLLGIPCHVIEPDLARASELHGEGVPVVVGEVDSVATFAAVRVEEALAVVANIGDAINTNVTLTVREAAAKAPVIAFVDEEDSIDLLELAGADHVVPLKRRLGEHLAGRVRAGHSQTHVVGRFGDLLLAEFPVHQTPFARRTIRDIGLRPALGINILGVWERGRLLPASPDLTLTDSSVPVVLATEDQLLELDTLLVIYDVNESPVLVIGGGKVGAATARALRARGVAVHIVERDPEVAARIEGVADGLFVGDAAAREVLHEAGIAEAPSVVLTTHDDATRRRWAGAPASTSSPSNSRTAPSPWRSPTARCRPTPASSPSAAPRRASASRTSWPDRPPPAALLHQHTGRTPERHGGGGGRWRRRRRSWRRPGAGTSAGAASSGATGRTTSCGSRARSPSSTPWRASAPSGCGRCSTRRSTSTPWAR